MTTDRAGASPVDQPVGRLVPERSTATPLMRSMLTRAAHLKPHGSTLVTEHVDGVCVQLEGRPVIRRTMDGMQKTIAFHWFVECRRSNKAAVHRLMVAADSKTPNVLVTGLPSGKSG